jgi:hypothetical protein
MMDQLLSIKQIPIKIEVNVTNAQFKRKEADTPSVKVTKGSSGGVKVAAQPYKVDISTAQRFDSYQQSPVTQSSTVKLTYNGVAKFLGDETAANVKTADSSTDLAARSSSRSIEAILSRLPKSKSSSISYNDGTLSINYSMDSNAKSDESTEIADLSSGFEFIPGSIEFVVSQMPDLEIEYLGDPIYFPRSADPNYQGEVDVIA